MYNFTDGSICGTTDNMSSEEGGLEEKVSGRTVVAKSGPESLGSTWSQENFIFLQAEKLSYLVQQIKVTKATDSRCRQCCV